MRLLLVDDEIVSLNALKKRVDWIKHGFTEIVAVQDAALAKEVFSKNTVDLMLCDIEMPGESGLCLLSFVKEFYPATECIIVSCHADFGYIKEAMKYKASDYILKPIDYEELENQLLQFAQKRENSKQREQLGKFIERTQESKERGQEPGEDRIEIVKTYIEKHIQEKIHIEDLAKLVHLNDQHLMRTFKRETGQSILEYISQQRIFIASKLLKETDYSIQLISDSVGCEHYSYFTKLFKRSTGLTPSEYKKLQTASTAQLHEE